MPKLPDRGVEFGKHSLVGTGVSRVHVSYNSVVSLFSAVFRVFGCLESLCSQIRE